MSDNDNPWFRCTICQLTFDLKSVAQAHIDHSHANYEVVDECIEEIEDPTD